MENKDTQRPLTEAEQRRKERFDQRKAGLERDGYTARDLTIGVVRANLLAVLVMLPFVAVFAVWYVWVNDTLGSPLSLPGCLLAAGAAHCAADCA